MRLLNNKLAGALALSVMMGYPALAQQRVDQLNDAGAISGTNSVPICQACGAGIGLVKATFAQILTYIQANIVVPLTTGVSGTLPEANGGTGEATYSAGQVLIGNSTGGLTKATLTEGANVTITEGDGSITIAASGGGGSPGGSSGDLQKNDGAGGFEAAVSGADYAPATSGTAIQKGNGSGGFANAASGTDYAPATSGSAVLKGNGSGGFSSAAAGTDYAAAPGGSANTPLFNNGSGGFTNGTRSGNTTKIATMDASTPATGNCVEWDANDNLTDAGAPCGSGSGSIGATDGTTTVSPASTLSFGAGFVVTDGGSGTAEVALTTVTNDQSGGDYTILASDGSKTVLVGAHTYTLPQAGSTGFEVGWGGCFLNVAAGDATLATTTSTFDGAGGGTSLALRPGDWACPSSDGTDYPTVYGTNNRGYTSGLPLVGGGAGALPTTGTRSGNTTAYVTTTGTQTSGRCVEIDANGNHIAAAAGCGSGGGSGAMSLVSTQTANNTAATLEWTGLTGNDYQLRCRNLVPATNGVNVGIQFSIASTWITADYEWTSSGVTVAATPSGSSFGSLSDSAMNLRTSAVISNDAAGVTFTLNFYALATAVKHKMTGQVESVSTTPTRTIQDWYGAYTAATTAVDGLRVISTSNLNTGNCSLYSVQQ